MDDARKTLVRFLDSALAQKRERLCGFASAPRSQRKFLAELAHRFGSYVAPSAIIPELPPAAWSSPALAFVGPNTFGMSYGSLREAFESVDLHQGALLITADGRFGVWCDHHTWDDKVCVSVAHSAAEPVTASDR